MVKSPKITSQELADAAIKGIQEVKGHDIMSFDLRNLSNSVCDFFVVCHGTSDTQVEAIARSVQKIIQQDLKDTPIHKEGMQKAEWILLDYFNVVVHIFKEEVRSFYNLEGLWADAEIKALANQ
jgi:ribosome-associated protein